MGIDRCDAFCLLIDNSRKIIVLRDVTFDDLNLKTNNTFNTQDNFISFNFSGSEAEYFGNKGPTTVTPNFEQSSNSLHDEEDKLD